MALGVESSTSISFSGLQSGLDSDKIVDAAVKVAQQPIGHLDRQEAIVVSHQKTYAQVHSLLRNLAQSLEQMQSHQQFHRLQTASTDGSVVLAEAGAGARPNSFRIEVQALAQVQRTYSEPVASASEAGLLGTGVLEISRQDERLARIAIGAQTSLQGVADAINDAGAGVSAAILFDGAQYRLQLTGAQSGARSAFSFADAGLTLHLSAPNNTSQKAQDAQFVLDNFSSISRPTNIVSDVIPGVSLNFLATSPVPQLVSVHVDASAVLAQVRQFVAAYNEVVGEIGQATHYDGQTDHAKSVGDTTLNTLFKNLQATIGTPVGGPAQSVRALGQIGITSEKNGQLKIDAAKLLAAINTDAPAVARLFVYDPTTNTRGVAHKMQALVDRYTSAGSGTLSLSIDGMGRRTEALRGQKAKLQANVKKFETTLRDRYAKLEKQMAQIKSQTAYVDALKPQQQKR